MTNQQVESLEVKITASADQFKSEMKKVVNELKAANAATDNYGKQMTKTLKDIKSIMIESVKDTDTMSNAMTSGLSGVSDATKVAGGGVEDMGDSITSVAGMSGKALMGMGAVAGAVAAIVVKAVELVIKVVQKAIQKIKEWALESVDAALNAIESETLVSRVFGEMTKSIEDWSNQLAEAFGLNAYALRKHAATLYTISRSLGLTGENALTLAKNFTQLSRDMSAFYNIPIEDAFTKLRSGITGETEPLRKLGVIITQSTVKSAALRHGISETGKEMSEQQKVLARYMTVMEQTSVAQGAWSDEMDNPISQLRILQNRLKMVAINFGSIFIPIIQRVLPYLQAFVSIVNDAVNALMRFFGVTGVSVDRNLSAMDSALEGTRETAEDTGGAVRDLKNELLGLAGFDEMNVLEQPDTSGGGGGGGGGGGEFSDFVLPDYDFGFDRILDKADELKRRMKEAFEEMKEPILAVVTALGILLATMGAGSFLTFVGVIMAIVGGFALLWSVSEDFREGFKFLADIVGDLVVSAFELLKSVLGFLWNLIEPLVGLVGTILGAAFTALGYILQPIIELVDWLAFAFDWLGDVLEPLFEVVEIGVTILGEALGTLIESLGGVLGGLIDLITPFKDTVAAKKDSEDASKDLEQAEKDLKRAQDDLEESSRNLIDIELRQLRSKGEVQRYTERLTELTAEGKEGTDEYRETQLKLMKAENDLKDDTAELTEEQKKYNKNQDNLITTTEKVTEETNKEAESINKVQEEMDAMDSRNVESVGDKIKNNFDEMVFQIQERFGELDLTWEDVGDGLRDAFSGVIKSIKWMINTFIIRPINNSLGFINLIPKVNIGKVPYLAQGGIVDSPTLSLIGEAGKEAVVPLENNTEWMDKLANKIGGGSGELHLTVKVGDDVVGEKVIDYISDKNLRTNLNTINI